MPQVIYYDSACKLLSHIFNSIPEERDTFKNTIVAVDAFHFKSHKEDDCFCNLYPQLKKENRWKFNSSAAELTNILYGKFASICWNMTAVQYNFFLDEMVRLRNDWVAEMLGRCKDIDHIGDINF